MIFKRLLSHLILCIALMMVLAGTALAQGHNMEDTEDRVTNFSHDHIIKLRPLEIGQIGIAFEKLRTSRVSNEISVGYIYKSYLNGTGFMPEDKKVDGVSIRMSQKHYTSEKLEAPFGFYHGPAFGYRLLIFERDAFGMESMSPSDPNYRKVGRLYQNSLDLSYQIGGQFQLGKHFTTELGLGLGARLKLARSVGGEELLLERIIGHSLVSEKNSAVFVVPMPQLNFSLGYSF